MHCPFCRHPDSRVIDSRTADDGVAIRRRRACPECGKRFTTQETVILTVAKRSGVTEPFVRDKIVRGVRRACQGHPGTAPGAGRGRLPALRLGLPGIRVAADFEKEIEALREERQQASHEPEDQPAP